MKLVKEGKTGRTFQTDKSNFKILYRNKGTISGDNDVNPTEEVYLVTGSAEITLTDRTWKVEAPVKIDFPAKTYHKIKAITDISFVIFES